MDAILPLLKAAAKAGTRRASSRRGSHDQRRHDNNTSDIQTLLQTLAKKLIDYAVQHYLESDHDQNRRRYGGGDVNFEALKQLGKKLLENILDLRDANSEKHSRPYRGGERSRSRERRRRRRRSHEDDRHRQRRRHRDERHDRGRRRHHHEDRRSDHRHRLPRRSPSPGSPDEYEPRHRRRRRSVSTGPSPLPSPLTKKDCQSKVPSFQSLGFTRLRTTLEEMSSTLIELSERPMQEGEHGECQFYEKFVDKSGPLQGAIGGVLGDIQQAEEKAAEAKTQQEGTKRPHRRRRFKTIVNEDALQDELQGNEENLRGRKKKREALWKVVLP